MGIWYGDSRIWSPKQTFFAGEPLRLTASSKIGEYASNTCHMSFAFICWKIQTSQNLPNIFERLQRIYIKLPRRQWFHRWISPGRWQFAHLCLETVLWKDLREKDGKGWKRTFQSHIFHKFPLCLVFKFWTPDVSFRLGKSPAGHPWASMRRRRDKIDVTCSDSWKIRPFGDVFYFP